MKERRDLCRERKPWRCESWICHPAAESWGHPLTPRVPAPAGGRGNCPPHKAAWESGSQRSVGPRPGAGSERPLHRPDAHGCRCPPRPLTRHTGTTSQPVGRVHGSTGDGELRRPGLPRFPLGQCPLPKLPLRLLGAAAAAAAATQNQTGEGNRRPHDTRWDAPGGAQLCHCGSVLGPPTRREDTRHFPRGTARQAFLEKLGRRRGCA